MTEQNKELENLWKRLRVISIESKGIIKKIRSIEMRQIKSLQKKGENQVCQCGHKHKDHGLTIDLNFSAGCCEKCECRHFLIQPSKDMKDAERRRKKAENTRGERER